jgi:hypothetical protein
MAWLVFTGQLENTLPDLEFTLKRRPTAGHRCPPTVSPQWILRIIVVRAVTANTNAAGILFG